MVKLTLKSIWEQKGIDSAIQAFEDGISPLMKKGKKKTNRKSTGEDIPTLSLEDLQKGELSKFFVRTDDIDLPEGVELFSLDDLM